MAEELNKKVATAPDFSDLFGRVSRNNKPQKYKRIAFCLSGLARSDREWVLSQLGAEDQQIIVEQIKSLKSLGIEVTQEMGMSVLSEKPELDDEFETHFDIYKDFRGDIPSIALLSACDNRVDMSVDGLEITARRRVDELRDCWHLSLPENLKEAVKEICS